MKFASVNFMTQNPFTTVEQDRFRRFEFSSQKVHPFSDFICDDSRDLIIVGCGFMGDGIIRAHGEMRAGNHGVDGRDISPTLPVLHEVTPELIGFYAASVSRILKNAKKIEEFGDFENVFWIAAPDMIEDTARFRLGDEFVDSGSFKVHKAAYTQAFQEAHGTQSGGVQFITHSPNLLSTQSGFTDNRFRRVDRPWDIHCSPKFYQGAMEQLRMKLLARPAISA